MSKLMRNVGTAMLVVMLAGSVSFAQSSAEALYKAKCQMCHGEKGMADSAAGKAMKVKPVTDPDVKKMSEAQMVEAVKNGMGKMQPYKDKLTDAQIKDRCDLLQHVSRSRSAVSSGCSRYEVSSNAGPAHSRSDEHAPDSVR